MVHRFLRIGPSPLENSGISGKMSSSIMNGTNFFYGTVSAHDGLGGAGRKGTWPTGPGLHYLHTIGSKNQLNGWLSLFN